MQKLKKAAMFTDIHYGRRNNSEQHNLNCLNFVKWFAKKSKEYDVDHIVFLGDWHEHRSSINGQTLHYSYESAKILNDIGLPVFFTIGNHDCFQRHKRDIFTTYPFESLENFILIDKPIVVDETFHKTLFCPYLFHDEYGDLNKDKSIKILMGHFEFAGFVVTGETNVMKHGPDHSLLKDKKRIFSGHFHKRQVKGNVMYIGNTFPMDFSDANDNDRGLTIYDYEHDLITHEAWPDAPKFIKCNLSDILEENNNILSSNSTVKCIVDVDISYTESVEIRNSLVKEYGLTELFLEENQQELSNTLENTIVDENDINTETTQEIIKSLISQIETENIDKNLLINIYEGKV
jgi:DNA repair exonuclease SbcCD nuclease subunit